MNRNDLWKEWYNEELNKDYVKAIIAKAEAENRKEVVSPDREYWFQAFEFPEFEKIHTVIVGDMPYYESAFADGFAFSSWDDGNDIMRRIYRKIYLDTGIIYDQTDNSKQKWLDRGILCMPMELTQLGGRQRQDRRLWKPFTITILRKFLTDIQARAFIFLDNSVSYRDKIFYDKEQWQHLWIQADPRGPRFFEIPIFDRVNDFVWKNYGINIDWS